jgi:hypothetical protein
MNMMLHDPIFTFRGYMMFIASLDPVPKVKTDENRSSGASINR